MKQNRRQKYGIAGCLLTAFILWTAMVSTLDLQAIGPQGSVVGLATMNKAFHMLTGVHMTLYHMTDWLSLLPLALAAGFGVLGLLQWLRRRSIRMVDRSILVLGVFYVVVLAAFLCFEAFVVNYRPVLIDGVLEASYPSSTTMLVMYVIPTAIIQLKVRIKKPLIYRIVTAALWLFLILMVLLRLLSGVHWLSDIIGGALLSAGLVMLYDAICSA